MAASRQTVEQTLTEIGAWRPAIAPLLRAFEPLLTAQADLTRELAADLRSSGPALPEPDQERVLRGVSLLAASALPDVTAPLRRSAEKLLPRLAEFQALESQIPALRAYFLPDAPGAGGPAASHQALAEAVTAGDHEALAEIARDHGLEPQVLDFAAVMLVAPVLRALAANVVPAEGEAFWDEGDAWEQGYCPVCGALPAISWLDKPLVDEKNAFLAGGGGKKHLHCGFCGANWKFRRGACPACGAEGGKALEVLRESGIAHGERLDCCTECKSYCPGVDLREREFVPDLDALALGMMHLDMVAARKKLRPLRPSFWNMF